MDDVFVFKFDTRNLTNIPFNKYDKDFIFIVNDQLYMTNRFVADLISPIIRKLHEIDETFSVYQIDTNIDGDFQSILDYVQMKEIKLNIKYIVYFQNIMKILGNPNETLKFSLDIKGEISFNNVISRMIYKNEMDLNYNDEISFIANNFEVMINNHYKELMSFDPAIIEQIIASQNLKIKNEDSLFDFIIDLYQRSKKYSYLFQYVTFFNVSQSSIEKFVNTFKIQDLDMQIWDQVCSRLKCKVSENSNFFNRYASEKRPIIKYLTDKYGGNIHSKGKVQISASSFLNNNFSPEKVVDNDTNSFISKNEPDSWILFDFKDMKVLLDNYQLTSYGNGSNAYHLKSWVLEAFDDEDEIEMIDFRKNCDDIRGSFKSETFNVSQEKPRRFIRLRSVGKDWFGHDYLVLSKIEFFGVLCE